MAWNVELHPTFSDEIDSFDESVSTAILATASVLENHGPQLGRPYVDTLNDSNYANMKELRITVPDGEWRVAFAFDPNRSAILLVAGSKSGKSQKLFYRQLIREADKRYAEWLESLHK